MVPAFKVVQNPHDHLYYVVGLCGGGRRGKPCYMPVSDGFKTRTEASRQISRIAGAERSARDELRGGSLAVHA